MKRSPLRRYAFMKRRSDKVRKAQPGFQAVYDEVNRRSEGRCEWTEKEPLRHSTRCRRLATDHHHLAKPRREHHLPGLIIHLCRDHHERCEWPYARGRGVVQPIGVRPDGQMMFRCDVVYAPDKFAARGQG